MNDESQEEDERDLPPLPLIDEHSGLDTSNEGCLWIIAPWLLIFKSRLSYTMVEMMILTIAVAVTLGSMVSLSLKMPGAYTPFVILFLALLHVHLMLFAWPLYYLRTKAKAGASVRGERLRFILVSQAIFTAFPVVLSLIAKGR